LRNLFSEASDSFRAYAASGHRHLPEMQQNLRNAGADALGLSFVPHLVPMVRGIHATLYAELISNNVDVQAVFVERFRAEPFVDVMPAGSHPETRSVRGANLCRIAIHRPEDGRRVIVLSVIDNLVKGAAGQAIQNMNLMFGFDETAGLGAPALLP
jgi:N-acetyl-gamma-glutamyl-phosphate reductase